MHVSEKEVQEFILDSGLVSRKDVDAALEEVEWCGQSLGDVLVSRGSLSEDSLRRVHAYVLGIPFVQLGDAHIPIDVLALIPEPIARTHNIVAYKKDENDLEVALLDIADLAVVDVVGRKTGLKINPRFTDAQSIRQTLLQYQKSLKSQFGDHIARESEKVSSLKTDSPALLAESASIIRIVDTLLHHAIIQKASDIHIEPAGKEVLVRYRINGALHDAMVLPSVVAAGIVARIKLLSNLKLDESHIFQDGRFKMETEADHVSFRVSVLPTLFGEKIVMRVLRETGEGFTLETLGFHGMSLERIHRALKTKAGLVIVCGPLGSGKTTTLYTMLDILNAPDVNISTIEDPVEYQMKRVNQVQVDSKVGLTFANGLRSLMRQDPDVLMLGDIPDKETASLAISAVLAGHLVLASLTADSAASAISRLIDMGVEPSQLASTLTAVIGERLVRKLAHTKESYRSDAKERMGTAPHTAFNAVLRTLHEEKLAPSKLSIEDVSFFRPSAKAEGESGYTGHTGVQEVLTISPAVRDLILKTPTPDALEAQARKEGMLTVLEDGIYKAARGITSLEEVRTVATR